MKAVLLGLIMLCSASIAFGQDTILKRNGEKVIAKVLEVSPTDVKYKKFTMLDGPTYVENKSDIQMITYLNGVKDEFTAAPPAPQKNEPLKVTDTDADYYSAPARKEEKIVDLKTRYHYQNRAIGQSKMHKILLDTKDREIGTLVTQAKQAKNRQMIIGFSAIPLGITTLVCMQLADSDAMAIASLVGMSATISAPFISGMQRRKKVALNSKAIKLYNERF